MKFLMLLCLLIAVAACNPVVEGRNYPAYPTPDLTTPDNALKSYWAYQDHSDLIDSIKSAEIDSVEFAASRNSIWSAVTSGPALSFMSTVYNRKKPSYGREIISVKQETETRAVIVSRIRNTTPYAHYISESDMEERREGKRIDYVIEKDSMGWKIVQARFRYFGEPTENDLYFEELKEYVQTHVSP